MSLLRCNFRGCLKQVFTTNIRMKSSNAVLGIPYSKGQPKKGVDFAPDKIREMGLLKRIKHEGATVVDYGNLSFEEFNDDYTNNNVKLPRTNGAAMKKISDTVKTITESNDLCVNLGGDHSIAIGTLHGHLQAQPDTVVVWVDAHTDINPPLHSPSGNLHGMVLSFLCHELQKYVPPVVGFEWLQSCLSIKDIAYIGVRDIDYKERFILKNQNMTYFTTQDVLRHGIPTILERALDKINPGMKRPIHLSFDIDALDPTVAPSTGTRVPGGLTLTEGIFIARELGASGKLQGFDLVEVNPSLGSIAEQQQTVLAAVEVICAAFANNMYVPDHYK